MPPAASPNRNGPKVVKKPTQAAPVTPPSDGKEKEDSPFDPDESNPVDVEALQKEWQGVVVKICGGLVAFLASIAFLVALPFLTLAYIGYLIKHIEKRHGKIIARFLFIFV